MRLLLCYKHFCCVYEAIRWERAFVLPVPKYPYSYTRVQVLPVSDMDSNPAYATAVLANALDLHHGNIDLLGRLRWLPHIILWPQRLLEGSTWH